MGPPRLIGEAGHHLSLIRTRVRRSAAFGGGGFARCSRSDRTLPISREFVHHRRIGCTEEDIRAWRARTAWRSPLLCLGSAAGAFAQDAASVADLARPTLRQAFETAWARQPEALALRPRRDAAQAQQQAAQAWTPEPPALIASNKTDRFNRNMGMRELEVGVAIPLWLPDERARSGAVAEAETSSVESRALAAQLRLAGVLRESWWQWQRAQVDADIARDQLANARLLATDVGKRFRAGDLARADQHQADGAVAAAESAVARALAAAASAAQQLRVASAGAAQPTGGAGLAAPEPEPMADLASAPDLAAHPAYRDLQDRAAVAESAAALGAVRSRANRSSRSSPRTSATFAASATTRRSPSGCAFRSVPAAVTPPEPRPAQAEATELQAQLALERERIMAEQDAARLRLASTRAQLAAADRRAQLADESRGFFDKSFRLGQTDLPTRLRIEAEAVEARRQAATARIEAAAAISQWRQALGLLPQ